MRIKHHVRYINVGEFYLSAEKKAVVLFWLLLMKTKPFHLHANAHNKWLRWLPRPLLRALRVIRIIGKLLRSRAASSERNGESMHVPYDGHLLLPTTEGFKVFDLHKDLVVTQYDEDTDHRSFLEKVEMMEKIARYGLSPQIFQIDEEKKVVCEEYINCCRANRFYPVTPDFYRYILPIWQRNIETYPKLRAKLFDYTERQKTYIQQRIQELEREGCGHPLLASIRTYVDQLAGMILSEYDDTSVYLSLSHGDFHAWNVLLDKDRATLIDWNTMKERSVFHDLHYIFIHHLFGNPEADAPELMKELNRCCNIAVIKVQKILELRYADCRALDVRLYRRLFYLEYIHLDFEKRIFARRLTGRQLFDRLKKINECIHAFKRIESCRVS